MFSEEDAALRPPKGSRASQKTSLVDYVIKFSGGRVTNNAQANLVLLIVVFVCVVVATVLLYSVMSPETPVPVPYTTTLT